MRTLFLSFLFILPGLYATAQQSGNYVSEIVEARTWSRGPDRKVIISDWKPFESRLVGNLKDFTPLQQAAFSKYGGDLNSKVAAKGFFYPIRQNGRWWVADPEGYLSMHIAVNSLVTGRSKRNQEAFDLTFGSKEKWMSQTASMLTEAGFNGTGSWSDTEAIVKYNQQAKTPLVYTVNLSFMSQYGDKRGGTYQLPGHKGYPNNTIFVFDPQFEEFCDQKAREIIKYKNDPNLYGYFSDNEMPLNKKNLEGYLSLPNKQDPGYLAAKKWLEAKGIKQEQITDQHREEFLAFVADRYFSIVSKALHKYDPNHMYLGCRFYSSEKNTAAFMKTAGKYLDVVTINYYGAWTPSKQDIQNWATWTGRPFMITEFYTKGEDSGLGNTSGAGWIVRTQVDRGKAYQNFCLGLLESKSCVGWHWFKYQDNDPTLVNAEPSNIDANKGLINNYYQPYSPLTEKMKELNLNRYQLIKYLDKANSTAETTSKRK